MPIELGHYWDTRVLRLVLGRCAEQQVKQIVLPRNQIEPSGSGARAPPELHRAARALAAVLFLHR
jgi:hypothetical protein